MRPLSQTFDNSGFASSTLSVTGPSGREEEAAGLNPGVQIRTTRWSKRGSETTGAAVRTVRDQAEGRPLVIKNLDQARRRRRRRWCRRWLTGAMKICLRGWGRPRVIHLDRQRHGELITRKSLDWSRTPSPPGERRAFRGIRTPHACGGLSLQGRAVFEQEHAFDHRRASTRR